MSERFITDVRKERGRVVAVSINDGEYELNDVIDHIRKKDEGWEDVYTLAEGFPKRRVFVKELWTGTRFLCSAPDGIKENNLGELPQY